MAKTEFKFNLLPPKSKEAIAKEEKRSNTLLYSSILLFSIAFIWVIINLLGTWVKEAQVRKWEKKIDNKDQEIATYEQYRLDNYELYQKSNVLGTVVLKHTDPDLVFNLINDRIKNSTPNVVISKYGRNASGNYQITGSTGNIDDIAKLLTDFKAEENVEDVSLISMGSQQNKYEFILDLSINESTEN